MKTIRILILSIVIMIPLSSFAPNYRDALNDIVVHNKLNNLRETLEVSVYQNAFDHLKTQLAVRESSNDWTQHNQFGYIGKFQFGAAALEATGYGHIEVDQFIENPYIWPEPDQEKAMDSLIRINEFLLKKYIKEYEGKTFLDSIKISKLGMLAASHLAGHANVKEFLRTNGDYNPKDQFGTRLSDYLILFSMN